MGEIAALSASALWATASLMFARLGKSIGPLVINILKCVIALVLMFLVLLALEGRLWPAGLSTFETGMLALSGLAGLTLGDTACFNALNRLGPRRTLLLAALTPPMTAIMAVFVLDEPITVELLAGMVLTLGGVVWVILERHPGDDQLANLERQESHSGLSRAEKIGIVRLALG